MDNKGHMRTLYMDNKGYMRTLFMDTKGPFSTPYVVIYMFVIFMICFIRRVNLFICLCLARHMCIFCNMFRFCMFVLLNPLGFIMQINIKDKPLKKNNKWNRSLHFSALCSHDGRNLQKCNK